VKHLFLPWFVPPLTLGIALFPNPAQAQPRAFPGPFDDPPFRREWGPREDGPRRSGPKVGDPALDFELKHLAADATFRLRDNFGKRPTVLIFHSFT
jgi:hypothetical protein